MLAFLMIISVFLTGCLRGRYDPNLSIGEQIRTGHYNHSAMTFGKNELLDEILDASEDGDEDRILDLFSDYALEENEDLEDEIEEYLDCFPDIDELTNRGCSQFSHRNRRSDEQEAHYEPVVCIDDHHGDRYRLVCIWIECDSEDPDRQGIHSIQLISEDCYDRGDFTIHSVNDRPGVYVYIE